MYCLIGPFASSLMRPLAPGSAVELLALLLAGLLMISLLAQVASQYQARHRQPPPPQPVQQCVMHGHVVVLSQPRVS